MRFFHTLGGYVTGVVMVWAAIFVVGYFRRGSTPGYPLLHVFGGFMLGCSPCTSPHVFIVNPDSTIWIS